MTHDTTTPKARSQATPDRPPFLSPSAFAMLWAGVVVFLTAGYFQNSRPGWNANSQFALTCAIVERGTFSIDAYHAQPQFETGDKAFFQGHYYCDKSPVTAFLGVPVFWLYSTLSRGLLGRPLSYDAARYWVTWWVNGLAAALLAAMTAALLLRRGVAPGRAALAGALWIITTPLLGYAILFYNYLPACALALGSFLVIERLWNDCGLRIADCGVKETEVRRQESGVDYEHDYELRLRARKNTDFNQSAIRNPQSAMGRCLLGGLLLGLAAWTLNTMALVALVLTLGVVLAPAERPGQRAARLAAWAVGGVLGIAGNFIYTHVVFHTWGSPYAFEADPFFREHMAQGLMGATWPRPLVAWLITFHPFQGLFFWFPLALAALGGTVWTLFKGRRAQKLENALALAILAGLVLYTSGYFLWWGGWAYMSRHLIPVLPLLALGLAPWLTARRAPARWALWTLALAGLVLNLAAVAVNPQHPTEVPQEVLMSLQYIERWYSPMWALQAVFWEFGYADNNWGTALGLHGPASLIPLLALWGLGGGMLYWFARSQPAAAAAIIHDSTTDGPPGQKQQAAKNKPPATRKRQRATGGKGPSDPTQRAMSNQP